MSETLESLAVAVIVAGAAVYALVKIKAALKLSARGERPACCDGAGTPPYSEEGKKEQSSGDEAKASCDCRGCPGCGS